MNAARLAARCVELLGPTDGPVVVVMPDVARAAVASRLCLARDDERPQAAVSVFLGEKADPVSRRVRLRALAGRMPIGAPLLVVDHNQPRTWWRRGLGALVLLARGLPPSRARYPAAIEVRDEGFVVERLRLADGERVQLIVARRN